MSNLIGYNNAGYVIQLQGGKQAVIGYDKESNLYVAWNYHFENDKPHFYWGRYGDYESVLEAFYKKENNEYKRMNVSSSLLPYFNYMKVDHSL